MQTDNDRVQMIISNKMRLPPEILATIFIKIVDTPHDVDSLSNIYSLSYVCKTWSRTINSNPTLFATFSVVIGAKDTLLQLIEKKRMVHDHIRRSGTCKLNVSLLVEDRESLDGDSMNNLCKSLLAVLMKLIIESPRWRRVELYLAPWIIEYQEDTDAETIVVESMPHIERLVVDMPIDDNTEQPIFVPLVFSLLGSHDSLQYLNMQGTFPLVESSQNKFSKLTKCVLCSLDKLASMGVMEPLHLYNLVKGSPRLQSLEWSLHGFEGDEMPAVEWKPFPSGTEHITVDELKTLTISGVTDHFIWEHFTMPNISSISVEHYGRESSIAMASFIGFSHRSFSKVTRMELQYQEIVYDDGEILESRFLALFPNLLQCLPQLKIFTFKTDVIYLTSFTELLNDGTICPGLGQVHYEADINCRFGTDQASLSDAIGRMAISRSGTLTELSLSFPNPDFLMDNASLKMCATTGMKIMLGDQMMPI